MQFNLSIFFEFKAIKMIKRTKNSITFDKWKEAMSKEIFLYNEDRNNILKRLYEMFCDDYDEEESPTPKKKKR